MLKIFYESIKLLYLEYLEYMHGSQVILNIALYKWCCYAYSHISHSISGLCTGSCIYPKIYRILIIIWIHTNTISMATALRTRLPELLLKNRLCWVMWSSYITTISSASHLQRHAQCLTLLEILYIHTYIHNVYTYTYQYIDHMHVL